MPSVAVGDGIKRLAAQRRFSPALVVAFMGVLCSTIFGTTWARGAEPASDDSRAAAAAEFMKQAAAAYADGDLELTAEFYQKACAVDPENAEACYRLAAVYETMGDVRQAISAYEVLKKVGTGGRWANLAETRLVQLRSRAALDKINVAEKLAANESYADAMRCLRDAVGFAPPPPADRLVRSRFYKYAADDVAARLGAEMNERQFRTLAVADIVPGSAYAVRDAAYFSSMLRAALARNKSVAVVPAEVPAPVVQRLTTLSEGEQADPFDALRIGPEFDLRADGAPMGAVLPQADCLLVGIWSQYATMAVVSLPSGDMILNRRIGVLGAVPPVPLSEAWNNLPRRSEVNTDLWAWVWGEDAIAPEATSMRLNVQVSQSCYVVLIQITSEGSLKLILPSKLNSDNFLRERDEYPFDCSPDGPGGVGAVWMIAARTPLVTWPGVSSRADPAATALKIISEQLPALPRADWTISTWTWGAAKSGS